MEIGICSFADVGVHPISGEKVNPQERLRNLMEEIELADQLGLDVFAVGEHHRPDYAVSSPTVVLAAAAMRTKNIRLSSGVTVLSSDDPVRVYQQFATVDLLSGGRAVCDGDPAVPTVFATWNEMAPAISVVRLHQVSLSRHFQ